MGFFGFGKKKNETEIIAVEAYWRNDRPGGLGLRWDFSPGQGNVFGRSVERNLQAFDKRLKADDCVFHLQELGKRKSELSHDARMTAISMIHWLERRGHLVPDTHNGLVWYARCGSELLTVEGSLPDHGITL